MFIEVENKYPFTVLRVSPMYTFTNDKHCIEFVCGLCWNIQGDKLVVSMGIDDNRTATCEINPQTIFNPTHNSYPKGTCDNDDDNQSLSDEITTMRVSKMDVEYGC